MAQQVKDLASLQRLGSLLWHGFNPWLGDFHMLPRARPKKKKKKKNRIGIKEFTRKEVQMQEHG